MRVHNKNIKKSGLKAKSNGKKPHFKWKWKMPKAKTAKIRAKSVNKALFA